MFRQKLFQISPRVYIINVSKANVDRPNSRITIPVTDACQSKCFHIQGQWEEESNAINFTGELTGGCSCTVESVKKFYNHAQSKMTMTMTLVPKSKMQPPAPPTRSMRVRKPMRPMIVKCGVVYFPTVKVTKDADIGCITELSWSCYRGGVAGPVMTSRSFGKCIKDTVERAIAIDDDTLLVHIEYSDYDSPMREVSLKTLNFSKSKCIEKTFCFHSRKLVRIVPHHVLILFCIKKKPKKVFIQTGNIVPDERVFTIGRLNVKHTAAQHLETEIMAWEKIA
jgi:hypothetical protein